MTANLVVWAPDVYDSWMIAMAARKNFGHAAEAEREFLKGALSDGVRFRLFTTGSPGTRELTQLIRLLEQEKEVLSEDADGDDLDRLIREDDD